MARVIVKPADSADRPWLADFWRASWGDVIIVSRGRVHRLEDLAALIAWDHEKRVGAATYWLDVAEAELTSLNASEPGRGIGTALIDAVETAVRAAGVHRLWLITTNANVDALRFYQRRGFRLARLHPGAIDAARKIKPTIPEIGEHGIPIRDEIELEKRFDAFTE